MVEENRRRAAAKALERIRPFYPKANQRLDAIDSWKLISRLKAWAATSNILALNPDKALVVSAYYPNPLEQWNEVCRRAAAQTQDCCPTSQPYRQPFHIATIPPTLLLHGIRAVAV